VARPLFSEPGRYTIKCLVGFGAYEPGHRLEQVIDIVVGTPQGDDAAILQLLKQDEALAFVLMRPVDRPEETLIPKLKDLIEQFPKSSYADYARFALARGYWRGIGVHPPSRRVATALAADQLQKIVENRWDATLKKVVPSRFAYLPNALILWKLAEPLGREDTLRRLDRVFPDAAEWLEEVAASLMPSNSEGRKDVEFLLNQKFTTSGSGPFNPFDTGKAPIADGWKSYRQRIPRAEEEPRRAP
jgi:hypothetical protein